MMLSTATSSTATVRPSRGQRGWGLKVDARRTVQSLSATGKVRLGRTCTFDLRELPNPSNTPLPSRRPCQATSATSMGLTGAFPAGAGQDLCFCRARRGRSRRCCQQTATHTAPLPPARRAKVFGPYSENIVPSHLKGEFPGGERRWRQRPVSSIHSPIRLNTPVLILRRFATPQTTAGTGWVSAQTLSALSS